ncbi:DUF4857 domain-containing protein [Campylobacter geochelonis]|uniref:DUF4857 domain-containing protein n=1 Tax=Campylobacter geochelonis TaxID=1780362 RepID=UPI000770A345|nr:DUF4857 domain-containing protein [Campylobacter geochelonis]CZE49972.1 Uncharacterised protein [Campylobacter geochelonis]
MGSIFLKEISRLKGVFIFLALVLAGFFLWFCFKVRYDFGAIHPESVIWYGYNFFDNHPESVMAWVWVILGVGVSLAQFLSERARIKCLLHLPKSSAMLLLEHFYPVFILFGAIWLVFGGWLLVFSSFFYPVVILEQIAINWCYYALCGVLFYIFTNAVVINKNAIFSFALAVVFTVLSFMVLFYLRSFLVVILLAVVGGILCFNSLLSHKQTSLKTPFLGAIYVVLAVVFVFGGVGFYDKSLKEKKENYYIFYSPSLKEFIYQHNLGGHYFAYKSASGKEFKSEKEYKNELAFNYYMDLEQQGKLPVVIDGESFSKERIKNARFSMSYTPADAKPPQIPLYPLFNPDPKVSSIPFSEDMIYFAKNGLEIYHHDGNLDKEFSSFLNDKALNLDVKFPAVAVWGRFTNLKPYDSGIFFKDSKGDVFNITVYDNKLDFKEIPSLKNFEHLHVNESKNSDFLAIAFKYSKIYLMDKKYLLTKLDVGEFNWHTMRLRVAFDAKYLQVRYDDGRVYKAFAFDKDDFKEVDKFQIK